MADTFDPYAAWLGIQGATPQTHYELLGLPKFEADPHLIAVAADTRSSKVRSFRPGAHARAWQALLDELATAKRTLLDPAAKAKYDAAIKAGQNPSSSAAPSSTVSKEPLGEKQKPKQAVIQNAAEESAAGMLAPDSSAAF